MIYKEELVKSLKENRPQLEDKYPEIKGLTDEGLFKHFYKVVENKSLRGETIFEDATYILKDIFVNEPLLFLSK